MTKTVVVTGAARGLGRAVVDEFSAGGWAVVAVVRSPDATFPWRSEKIRPVVGDVRHDLREPLLEAVGERAVDVLVNNAGVGSPQARLADVTPSSLMDALDVNVAGPVRMVQALLPALLAAPRPLILNVSSRLGSLSVQARGDFTELHTSYAYRVSKAAQNMLTISMAHELRGRARCWAVHPGKVVTSMGRADAAKSPEQAAKELRELAESSDTTSPRFCSLGAADLDW
jgi:NAD(P)-dependent dehydrogenase (short-subunit alcohol dehydrogenase family)